MYDYNSSGSYFITICTKDRKCILSKVVGTGVPDCPKIVLLKHGIIAEKYIHQLNEFYSYISVENFVIMPNHIHMMVFLIEGQSGTPVPTDMNRANNVLSKFVSTFKRFYNKEYGENVWQSPFNDHIIRNNKDYEEHMQYIYENPARWIYDEMYEQNKL